MFIGINPLRNSSQSPGQIKYISTICLKGYKDFELTENTLFFLSYGIPRAVEVSKPIDVDVSALRL